MLDMDCLMPIVFILVFIAAGLIFVEDKQVKRFNFKFYSLGPRFIRVNLSHEIATKLLVQSVEEFPIHYGEWYRVGPSKLLFYWSGTSEKRNPTLLAFKGSVILDDQQPYAEGRLNLAGIVFLVLFLLFAVILSFDGVNVTDLTKWELAYRLGLILSPIGFLTIFILAERGNFREALEDIGVEH